MKEKTIIKGKLSEILVPSKEPVAEGLRIF